MDGLGVTLSLQRTAADVEFERQPQQCNLIFYGISKQFDDNSSLNKLQN